MDKQAEEIISAFHQMWREWYNEYNKRKVKQASKMRRDSDSEEDTPILKKDKKDTEKV